MPDRAVPQRTVNHLAKYITEDIQVFNEAMAGKHNASRKETYEVDEVPLADGVLGTVTYQYSCEISGQHRPATREDPEEYPDIEIYDMEIEYIEAFDEATGEPIPAVDVDTATKREWVKAATDYFDKLDQDTLLPDDDNSEDDRRDDIRADRADRDYDSRGDSRDYDGY